MGKQKKYNLDQILKMDEFLMSLAAYESSEGLLSLPESIEGAKDYNEKVKKQFNVFKKMIQSNECSIDELEQMVLRRHGPVGNPYMNLTMTESLQKICEEDNEIDAHETPSAEKILQDIFGQMTDAMFKNETIDKKFMDENEFKTTNDKELEKKSIEEKESVLPDEKIQNEIPEEKQLPKEKNKTRKKTIPKKKTPKKNEKDEK